MKYVEKYYPLVLSVILTVLFCRFQHRLESVDEMVKKLLDAALAVSGALLGFLLTILTIINTIETRRMQFVRDSGNLPLLNRYLKVALYSNIASISIYFILPALSTFHEWQKYKVGIYAILVFIVAFTWIVNIRFSSVFIKLLTDPEMK